MKVPKARKLPSGQWFVRVMVDGQSYPITRPTEKEAVAEAVALKAGLLKAKATPKNALTLTKAIDDYIETRSNVRSPATLAGYRVIQKNRFQTLMQVKVTDIDKARWARAVNAEAKIKSEQTGKKLSAKTIKNSAMFIQTVIAEYGGEKLEAPMPQVLDNDLPWLTPDQIKVFLPAIKGNPYEIPMLLALHSLRKSEIAALQYKNIDFKKNEIRVRGAVVKDEKGKPVRKQENKNKTSRREIGFILPQLKEAVEAKPHTQEDYVFPYCHNVLGNNINKVCKENGLPKVGVHGLRRSFASLCYHLGIPEAITMEWGGWSELATMRKIYTKVSDADKKAKASLVEGFFKDL